jgi:hypothetical protein
VAPLPYLGRQPDNDLALMSKGAIDDRFAETSLNLQAVDDAVIPRRTELVLPSYYQEQDALRARKTYVDTQDDKYELRTSRGAANGLAPLGADGKIPAVNLPTAEDYPVLTYSGTNTTTSWTGLSSMRRLGDLSIPDPGYPYQILVFAHVGCRSEADWSRPQIHVYRNTTSYPIAMGFGTESQQWHWIKALPIAPTDSTAGVRFTGASNLEMWGSRNSGSATIAFTTTGFRFTAFVYPAI